MVASSTISFSCHTTKSQANITGQRYTCSNNSDRETLVPPTTTTLKGSSPYVSQRARGSTCNSSRTSSSLQIAIPASCRYWWGIYVHHWTCWGESICCQIGGQEGELQLFWLSQRWCLTISERILRNEEHCLERIELNYWAWYITPDDLSLISTRVTLVICSWHCFILIASVSDWFLYRSPLAANWNNDSTSGTCNVWAGT